jgi:pimeloyl-ACP methyl ester carboxylesterase
MSLPVLDRPTSAIEGAEWGRDTSFGASIYQGTILHEASIGLSRKSSYVETVPRDIHFPDSAIVINGGYTASCEHYELVQRELSLLHERSAYVVHGRHADYETGHNAEDVVATCEALAAGGITKQILLGHSMGAPEVLEAYELLMEKKSKVDVSDIVLAFPAQFIGDYPMELAKSLPLFAMESVSGFIRNPLKQMRFSVQIVRNAITDLDRTIKGGAHLLTRRTGTEGVTKLQGRMQRPRVHFVLGLYDGLVPGNSVLKTLQDSQHDTVTLLRTGHVEFNNSPVITRIIQAKVRGTAPEYLVA